VSGHPYRDEIKYMFGWLKPDSVVPVHGERVKLEDHAKLARDMGIQTLVPSNGSVIHLAPETLEIIDHVDTGVLAVEPGRVIDSNHRAIIQRRKLQYSGTIHASVVINGRLDLLTDPIVSTTGLVDQDSDDGIDFEEDMIAEIEDTLIDLKKAKRQDEQYVAEEIRIALRRYANHALRIKPKTDVHVSIL
ncbi:MAG: ribonuclease J, partial [Alphaproteobacteria bacterium]|nr:ribonuclease J [Alphaproteobacteria bacterium]